MWVLYIDESVNLLKVKSMVIEPKFNQDQCNIVFSLDGDDSEQIIFGFENYDQAFYIFHRIHEEIDRGVRFSLNLDKELMDKLCKEKAEILQEKARENKTSHFWSEIYRSSILTQEEKELIDELDKIAPNNFVLRALIDLANLEGKKFFSRMSIARSIKNYREAKNVD